MAGKTKVVVFAEGVSVTPTTDLDLIDASSVQTLTNKNLSDSTTAVVDVTDPTKKIIFDAGGTTGTKTTVAAAQTADRVVTLPNATDTLVGKATTDVMTNKTLTAPVIDIAVVDGQASAPSNPSAGYYKQYIDDADGKIHVLDSSGNNTVVGSGSSGRNYLGDWFDGVKSVGPVTNGITSTGNITISTTAWQASDTTKLIVANLTSGGLRETKSLKIDHVAAGAAFVQSPCFLLDTMDLGKPVSVSFDLSGVVTSDDYQVVMVRYNSSGTYQEQIIISGTASATTPFSARCLTGTANNQGFFVANSTSTDYYSLRFVRNSASDTTDISLDSVYVGPVSVVQGAAVTDWTSYTPTFSAGFGTTTAISMWWRRVGDSIEIVGRWTNGTVAASVGSVTYPNGLTNDIAKRGSVVSFSTRWTRHNASAASRKTGVIYINSSADTSFYFASDDYSTAVNPTSALNASDVGNTGETITVHVMAPITGWSSNVTMANRAVEEYASTTQTWGTTSTSIANNVPGISGSLGGTSTPAGTNFALRIRFQIPILATDKLEFELSTDRIAWSRAPNSAIETFRSDGTNFIGATVDTTSVSGTDVDVYFGKYRTGTTTVWSGTWYWRVRKVSGGASVGFPINAKNIVGDLTSAVPPSGIVGEFKISTGTNVTLSSAAYATVASIPFTQGWWDVSADILVDHGITTASDTTFAMLLSDPADSASTGETEGAGYFLGNYLVSSAGQDPSYSMRRIVYCDGTNLSLYNTNTAVDSITGLTLAIRVTWGTFTVGTANASGQLVARRFA